MWDNEAGIDTAFSDIEHLALKCKFNNCTHTNEPNCEIRSVIQKGEIVEERLLAYLKLKQENEYISDSKSYLTTKEKKYKEISKHNKN